jgi:hypothetical protein
MAGDHDPELDAETRGKLDAEVATHQAALDRATDEFQVIVLCKNYVHRIGEILREWRHKSRDRSY